MVPISISRALVIASIPVLALGLCAGNATAFTAANHRECNGKALKDLVSKEATDDINAFNTAVDADKRKYQPEEHCLRKAGGEHGEAFKNAGRHVKELRQQVIDAIIACNTDLAHKLLGEALHARQDMYAHTNFVFLKDEERAAAKAAFDHPDNSQKKVPDSLRTAAFGGEFNMDPKMSVYDQFNPIDSKGKRDPFPHGLEWGMHLDVEPWPIAWLTPGNGERKVKTGGVTKTAWKWAMESAQEACRQLVQSIVDNVSPELWNTEFRDWKRQSPTQSPPPKASPPPAF